MTPSTDPSIDRTRAATRCRYPIRMTRVGWGACARCRRLARHPVPQPLLPMTCCRGFIQVVSRRTGCQPTAFLMDTAYRTFSWLRHILRDVTSAELLTERTDCRA